MKRITALFFATLVLGCSILQPEKKDDDAARWIAAWLMMQTPGWEWNECRTWSGERNFIYNAGYQAAYATDFNFYLAWIRGNSTMDLTRQYPGWSASSTANRSVSGNTLCDMIEQVVSTPLGAVEFILIATTGGNDILRGIPNDRVIDSGGIIIRQTRALHPSALIGAISVHPTLVASANANKGAVNSGIKAHLDADGNGCWIDTLPVFGKSEGEPADVSQMYPNDRIHYNESMAWAIREAINTACGRYP